MILLFELSFSRDTVPDQQPKTEARKYKHNPYWTFSFGADLESQEETTIFKSLGAAPELLNEEILFAKWVDAEGGKLRMWGEEETADEAALFWAGYI